MLPAESVAVNVTIVSPSGNTFGASSVITGLGSMSSVAVDCELSGGQFASPSVQVLGLETV